MSTRDKQRLSALWEAWRILDKQEWYNLNARASRVCGHAARHLARQIDKLEPVGCFTKEYLGYKF